MYLYVSWKSSENCPWRKLVFKTERLAWKYKRNVFVQNGQCKLPIKQAYILDTWVLIYSHKIISLCLSTLSLNERQDYTL